MKAIFLFFTLSLLTIHGNALASNCEAKWSDLESNKSLKTKYAGLRNICDLEAKMIIGKMVRNSSSISYKSAKVQMFKNIDHHEGKVCSVYSKECLSTRSVPNHREMNAEHTWPKSKGADSKPAVSDLHHLFPCNSEVNSIRSSYPFCEVTTTEWTNNMSALGKDKDGTTCFEPPKEHRGNIARAMFYFSARYQMTIDPKQEAWFKKWNKEDPVDQEEIERNQAVSRIQRNTNPFVDQPELVDIISNF